MMTLCLWLLRNSLPLSVVNLQSGCNDNDGINDDNENDNDYVGKALLSSEVCRISV